MDMSAEQFSNYVAVSFLEEYGDFQPPERQISKLEKYISTVINNYSVNIKNIADLKKQTKLVHKNLYKNLCKISKDPIL